MAARARRSHTEAVSVVPDSRRGVVRLELASGEVNRSVHFVVLKLNPEDEAPFTQRIHDAFTIIRRRPR